jgi:hypothetical protein
MKQFNAAHLEVKKDFTEDFQTHPFECGWADEAIFWVMVEGVSGEGASLEGDVEISHDGFSWAKDGSSVGPLTEEGLNFVRVSHFGNWIRLNCRVSGNDPVFKLLIQIALKG